MAVGFQKQRALCKVSQTLYIRSSVQGSFGTGQRLSNRAAASNREVHIHHDDGDATIRSQPDIIHLQLRTQQLWNRAVYIHDGDVVVVEDRRRIWGIGGLGFVREYGLLLSAWHLKGTVR